MSLRSALDKNETKGAKEKCTEVFGNKDSCLIVSAIDATQKVDEPKYSRVKLVTCQKTLGITNKELCRDD